MTSQDIRKPDKPVIAIGVGLIVASAVIVADVWNLQASFGNNAIGPRMMPLLVAGLLALFGLGTIWQGWRAEAPTREPDDFPAVGWIVIGLVAMIALMTNAGFVVATACLFVATARAFGSRRLLLDSVVGLVVAFVIYLFFAKLLGISLPSGYLERFLQGLLR